VRYRFATRTGAFAAFGGSALVVTADAWARPPLRGRIGPRLRTL